MEITHRVKLNNSDIEEAIGLFLDANGVDTKNKKLDIDMTAGRKGTGVYATVTLENIPEETGHAPVDILVEPEEEVLDAVVQSTDPVPEVTDEDEDESTSLFS